MPDGGYDAHEGRQLRISVGRGAVRLGLPKEDRRAWALIRSWTRAFPELARPDVTWHVTQGGKSWQN